MTVTEQGISTQPGYLLLVDDDRPFLIRLSRAMESRGFTVKSADNVAEALSTVKEEPPRYAVVDMRLGDGNGLDVIEAIRDSNPDARTIMLTGYGNITTAVTAVKLGAVDYLAKPADADDIFAALLNDGEVKIEPPENPMSADRVRWEHIQRVYELCDRNVSETPPPAQHASPYIAAYSGQARSALKPGPSGCFWYFCRFQQTHFLTMVWSHLSMRLGTLFYYNLAGSICVGTPGSWIACRREAAI